MPVDPMDIVVTPERRVVFGSLDLPCAIGPNGFTASKHEGDGATPIGRWPLRRGLFRADRIAIPPSNKLPMQALTPSDGWCDAPTDPNYNQFVTLPYPASAETLWRDDPLYDVIIILGYNDDPVVRAKGSAIFMHVAQDDYAPTQGCVALAKNDLILVLAQLQPATHIDIRGVARDLQK